MAQNGNTQASSGGIGFFTLLGLVFIVLKLVGVINWSWWLVLLPLYGGLAFFLVVAVVIGLVGLIVLAFNRQHH